MVYEDAILGYSAGSCMSDREKTGKIPEFDNPEIDMTHIK